MSDSRQGPANMPRLSHSEAEQLISTRLDTPLPPDQNRILLAHLSTCPTCRAFAAQIEAMTQGLRGLPMLPASPTVSRQVRERIAGPGEAAVLEATADRLQRLDEHAFLVPVRPDELDEAELAPVCSRVPTLDVGM